MVDLSKYIQDTPIVDAIYSQYVKRFGNEQPRRYLGCSAIGHECERCLWFGFRNCYKEQFSGRMLRLFQTGHLAEERFTADLRSIGVEVHAADKNGQQFGVEALGGHLRGHLDGCAIGVPGAEKTWHLLEYKTHSAKSFASLQKEGVQASKPQHWGQMQAYMSLTGMKRALYLAVNKDTDNLYVERVKYEAKAAEYLLKKAERIITASQPPTRISDRPDFWKCKFCPAWAICHGSARTALPVPFVSCRQCCHATPVMEDQGGEWRCELHGTSLGVNSHLTLCEDHLTLPGLLPAESIDYGKDSYGFWIKFKQQNGEWIHGRGKGRWSSKELQQIPVNVLANPMALSAKQLFNATATWVEEDKLESYPKAPVWSGRLNELVEAWRRRYNEDLETAEPVTRCILPTHSAVEYPGGRLAVVYVADKVGAEIRETT